MGLGLSLEGLAQRVECSSLSVYLGTWMEASIYLGFREGQKFAW